MKIVVTGAGGFIGGAIVEWLLDVDEIHVVSVLRRWSSAARIARSGVEMRLADIRDPEALRKVFTNAHAVVHCAVGDRETTVDGFGHVLATARECGVDRLVYMSTVDVYGDTLGVVTETHPRARTGDEYGDMKLEAEELCDRMTKRCSMHVTCLRLPIVYGPFSTLWTIRPIQRLRLGWRIPEQAKKGICNLLYIDDLASLVENIVLRADGLSGFFNVVGPDRLSWMDYLGRLASAVSINGVRREVALVAATRSHVMQLPRALAKRILSSRGDQIMALYVRSWLAKRLFRVVERTIKTCPPPRELRLMSRDVRFDDHLLRSVTGWVPSVSPSEGIERSIEWAWANRVAGFGSKLS